MKPSPYTAFGMAVILTEGMKDTVRELRRCKRGSDTRRERKKLLRSQASYREHFMNQS